jgi:CheY-like chemotaxis protein
MQRSSCQFTVRAIGFDSHETARLSALLVDVPGAGPSYSCLHADSLQEPDLLIANGDSPVALARLACRSPDALQPALVIRGAQTAPDTCRWASLPRPIDQLALHHILAELLDTRVHALAQQGARARRVMAERRRRPRLAPERESPAFYTRLRQGPVDGAVLIVDKEGGLRNQVARVLEPRRIEVEWTDSLCAAVRLCDETAISLVLINTAAAGIEPYGLCSSIKSREGAERTPVVFLVQQSFQYDSARARLAGARGLLETPVAGRHLMRTFQKLLDLPV